MAAEYAITAFLRWVLAVMLVFAQPAIAAELRIGGTGNALGTMRLLGEAFAQINPGVTPVVLPSIGTSGAIKAVPKGGIDIGLSSRPLTEDESRAGMSAIEYARSPTVIAVHEKLKLTNITRQQIAEIFSGKLQTWPDGTRIRPVIRQPGDDNTKQIKSLSSDIEKAVVAAELQPGFAFASTDQEAADKIETIQGGIGGTTLCLIRSEKRSLRGLSIDGIAPTPENLQSGTYPLAKHFYFILPKEPLPVAKLFVAFVQSAAGRRILEQTGHYIP